ncbi:hypothetical protein GS501_06230 [Saccharibacter sp. 17.LH.SD]|uniref:hypothetical protein n=1 Tax=Saccharibacter sp. 17.LH.SD TaxID=2689393 RepID=UPI0013684B2A|nr:hypothetical protein [Saccharibacter sp. 17.LH.SD]MXV44642.1 hypothetical protein [Saccharibacter sp. 17.LH.SD]
MMTRNLFSGAALAVLSFLFAQSAHAEGMFGTGTTLDASYCKLDAPRQTVVYVDDMDIVRGKVEWARTIQQKLQQTLMPGERTTVVELSPANGQSKEIWSGCWPGVTQQQAANMANEHHFFSGDPMSALKEQKGFFMRDFGAAVTVIYKTGARPAEDVAINLSNPPKKSVIRSLASDGARYSNEHGTIRAILYSDMAENSELGSVYKSVPNKVDVGSDLGVSLHRSIFYAFGVGSFIKDDGQTGDNIRKFWRAGFASMGANVAGMGFDLNVPNAVPEGGVAYEVTLKDAGHDLHGRMSILMDHDGRLVDSWIGITRLHSVLLNGYWRCIVETKQCELSATTAGPLVTDSKSENLLLKRSNEGSSLSGGIEVLHGTIGVPGSGINLPVTAELTKED